MTMVCSLGAAQMTTLASLSGMGESLTLSPSVPGPEIRVPAKTPGMDVAQIGLSLAVIAASAAGAYGVGMGLGWCLRKIFPARLAPAPVAPPAAPKTDSNVPAGSKSSQRAPNPKRVAERLGQLIDGMTQVMPRWGRPARIQDRNPRIIHKLTSKNGSRVLQEMLRRKYKGLYKDWNLVIYQEGKAFRIRVADSWDPAARDRDIPLELGIKLDQIAEGRNCIFAGTLRVEGEPKDFRLVLTNNSGAYGRDIRIQDRKVRMIRRSLARRLKIRPERIVFRRVN